MLRRALDFKLMRSYLSLLRKFYENKNNAKSETSKNDGVYSYQKENRCNLKHTRFEDTAPLPK